MCKFAYAWGAREFLMFASGLENQAIHKLISLQGIKYAHQPKIEDLQTNHGMGVWLESWINWRPIGVGPNQKSSKTISLPASSHLYPAKTESLLVVVHIPRRKPLPCFLVYVSVIHWLTHYYWVLISYAISTDSRGFSTIYDHCIHPVLGFCAFNFFKSISVHVVFIFLKLGYFTYCNVFDVHSCCLNWQDFIFIEAE